jgi:hypothetical protein
MTGPDDGKTAMTSVFAGGQGRYRTADLAIFRRVRGVCSSASEYACAGHLSELVRAGSRQCGLLAVRWRSKRLRFSILQEFPESLVTDLRLAQDAFKGSALQLPVQRHGNRGVSWLAHDDVAFGLPDVLPTDALQKTDDLFAGKDRKTLGHAQRLCAGLEIAWDPHFDRHDGRSGIDLSPVSRVFEQQLNSLDEVDLGLLDRVALADDVQLKAAGHVPGAFLVNRSCQPHGDSLAVAVHARDGGRKPLRACQHLTVLKLRRQLFAAVPHSASVPVRRGEEIRVRSRLCMLVRPVGSQLGCQTNRDNLLIRSHRRRVQACPMGSAAWSSCLGQSSCIRPSPVHWVPDWVPTLQARRSPRWLLGPALRWSGPDPSLTQLVTRVGRTAKNGV